MREDLKDIIIDTSRERSRWDEKIKRYPKDNDLEFEPIKNSHSKYQRDRLVPLIKYLHKQVGRKWDDVYSEICSKTDPRNIRGYHLREHVFDFVYTNNQVEKVNGEYKVKPGLGFFNKSYGLYGLYVDDEGILRKPKLEETDDYFRKQRYNREKYNKSLKESLRLLSDTSGYVKVDNLWYYLEWICPSFNHSKITHRTEFTNTFYTHHLLSNTYILKHVKNNQVYYKAYKNRYNFKNGDYWYNPKDPWIIIPKVKKQLSKKEIKQLKLN